MIAPALPLDEEQRIGALRALRILDTMPDERFDRLTRMAQLIFGVPVALVSLVDSDRQWFKSNQGLAATETPRCDSFCGHAILDTKVMWVEDTHVDPRFHDDPLVMGTPKIRFYAGAPIHAPDGARIGTICVTDQQPRLYSSREELLLKQLADCVDDLLRSSTGEA